MGSNLLIEVKREPSIGQSTLGKLYIDGKFICDTLEDIDRGLASNTPLDVIKKIKVQGRTAIPSGTYPVRIDIPSPKFKSRAQYQFCEGKLPRLENVPGFSGILIHIGNTELDTDGCILVGTRAGTSRISGSTVAFKKLYNILKEHADASPTNTITLKIN